MTLIKLKGRMISREIRLKVQGVQLIRLPSNFLRIPERLIREDSTWSPFKGPLLNHL